MTTGKIKEFKLLDLQELQKLYDEAQARKSREATGQTLQAFSVSEKKTQPFILSRPYDFAKTQPSLPPAQKPVGFGGRFDRWFDETTFGQKVVRLWPLFVVSAIASHLFFIGVFDNAGFWDNLKKPAAPVAARASAPSSGTSSAFTSTASSLVKPLVPASAALTLEAPKAAQTNGVKPVDQAVKAQDKVAPKPVAPAVVPVAAKEQKKQVVKTDAQKHAEVKPVELIKKTADTSQAVAPVVPAKNGASNSSNGATSGNGAPRLVL